MEVILEKIGSIFDKLVQINDHLRELNGKVADHEKWIRERDWSINSADNRFQALEQSTDRFQSYIDERKEALLEFRAMQKTVAEHERYIQQDKGKSSERAKIFLHVLTLLGVVISALGIYLHK